MPAFEAIGAVPTAAPGLAIEDVSVKYGAVRAVRNVSFAVPPGTVAVLLGANGAGKSSLLGAVMGLVPTSARADLAHRRRWFQVGADQARCPCPGPARHRARP